jgi:hypothetical protein
MAHSLGMTVVGEGIETDGQLEKLLGFQCDEGQGYVFAPPVPPADVATLRAANPSMQSRSAPDRARVDGLSLTIPPIAPITLERVGPAMAPPSELRRSALALGWDRRR